MLSSNKNNNSHNNHNSNNGHNLSVMNVMPVMTVFITTNCVSDECPHGQKSRADAYD